jgi:hypothetical protein
MSLQAQPDTIYIDAPIEEYDTRSRREIRDDERILRRLERSKVVHEQAVLFEAGRLASIRFPALTFTYQRMLGEFFSAEGSVGLPINRIDVYDELTGPFSGIEARLGGRVYLSNYQGFRHFFSVDGWALHNPVRAFTLVQEADLPTFRARELQLDRKRQVIVTSYGFKSIGFNGFTFDFQVGIAFGRRGIFAEGDVNYVSTGNDPFFGSTIEQNEWAAFTDLRFGLALGYAF